MRTLGLWALLALSGCFDFDRLLMGEVDAGADLSAVPQDLAQHDSSIVEDAGIDASAPRCTAAVPVAGSYVQQTLPADRVGFHLSRVALAHGRVLVGGYTNTLLREPLAGGAWENLGTIFATAGFTIATAGVVEAPNGNYFVAASEVAANQGFSVWLLDPVLQIGGQQGFEQTVVGANNLFSSGTELFVTSLYFQTAGSAAGAVGRKPLMGGAWSASMLPARSYGGGVTTPDGVFVCGDGFIRRWDGATSQFVDFGSPIPSGAQTTGCVSMGASELPGALQRYWFLDAPNRRACYHDGVGGVTPWECSAIAMTSPMALAVAPCDPEDVFVVGNGGHVDRRTLTGGVRSFQAETLTEARDLLDVKVGLNGKVYVAGDQGALLVRQ